MRIGIPLGSIYLAMPWTLLLLGCCYHLDNEAMSEVKDITCESLMAVYQDAVDAGVEISPEQKAIIEGCL
jgi:hypothetical protein